LESFIKSIKTPRRIILLVKAGKPVDETIKSMSKYLEKDDAIIDGGNEWYLNTERRSLELEKLNIKYLGMVLILFIL
jgi:6-phosphogluconate dehydrogenase